VNPLSLLFRSGNQTIFLPQILLKLGALDFIVPVNIAIGARKKMVITQVYGADFDVKEDFGLGDFRITIDGQIGNTDSSTGAKICGVNKQVNALDFINNLRKLVLQKGPMEISDVNQEFATNFIGWGVKKIDQAFDLPFGGPSEPEGMLNKLGITRVVIMGFDIFPVPGGRYRFFIELLSDLSESDIFETDKINLFLEEK